MVRFQGINALNQKNPTLYLQRIQRVQDNGEGVGGAWLSWNLCKINAWGTGAGQKLFDRIDSVAAEWAEYRYVPVSEEDKRPVEVQEVPDAVQTLTRGRFHQEAVYQSVSERTVEDEYVQVVLRVISLLFTP